ncbi:hypothetical protein CB0940_06217 [Cercospora beticola]|uniref:Uncharacterized protein n=1 Tax=Cercospora beticola TaxID=122368 RepID=A0A2G5HX38_CERBT|nr:hypothetical protein CB0940_06217 [Cercospora beticola]PIA97106.1 hypothetical protein CB0940_06217 [Cercospora beticola]WPA98834.1 hypothetical protein RHO25_003447 [Cercospora beticola]CAK1360116.1 unnamed protein product [Cercospora beticola]
MFSNLFRTASNAKAPQAEHFELPLHKPRQGQPVDLSIPPEIEAQLKKFPADKQATIREKIRKFKDAIQPHTDEGGDAHYIGDAYAHVNPDCVREWSKDQKPGPYLQYVEAISKKLKHLEYLSLWMLVGCAPPKWRFIRNEEESRKERICRTNVCVIDYRDSSDTITKPFTSTPDLKAFLNNANPPNGQPAVRLVIAEDLSRDLVDMLGEHYDIDPLFFLSHIGDYLFHNTRDRWCELPDLDVDTRNRSHSTITYLRARYFQTEKDFIEAERQSGGFNVLRRLDGDRSRKSLQRSLLDDPEASVTLTRAKSSLWIKPRVAGEPVVAVLLVDPTVKTGHSIWGGYRPFEATPTMKQWTQKADTEPEAPPRTSLFDDVVYWSCRLTPGDLQLVKEDPKYIALPMYKLVIADWLVVLKYMTTMFGLIEWTFSKPHWGESPGDIDELLTRIAPWRRNVPYYQAMVDDSIARLFPAIAVAYPTTPANLVVPAPDISKGIYSLWSDFKNIKHQLDEHKRRIQSIQTMATNAINNEEARRAVKQNTNLARLSFLATFFIPLNFTSSFLSMSPDFPTASNYTTIWLFFVLGIPITILAFIIVDFTKPDKKGITRQAWLKIHPEKPKAAEAMGTQASEPGDKPKTRSTMGWLTNRAETFRRP